MPNRNNNLRSKITAQPRLHQHAPEIQAYGKVTQLLPLELEEPVRLEMTEQLNQLLADSMTLRDLYKKSHWQVAGPPSINSIFYMTSISPSRLRSWTRSPNEFSCSVV
jgi:DNA-binding ferritin-like protein (oxidative damage protectant)